MIKGECHSGITKRHLSTEKFQAGEGRFFFLLLLFEGTFTVIVDFGHTSLVKSPKHCVTISRFARSDTRCASLVGMSLERVFDLKLIVTVACELGLTAREIRAVITITGWTVPVEPAPNT